MTRLQPTLSDTETALVNQMMALTGAKRTDVVKNALTVYHWFLRQAVTGAQVLARKPTGEEIVLQTAEFAALEGQAQLMSPEELGIVAKKLARASDPKQATRLRERLARGFYGV